MGNRIRVADNCLIYKDSTSSVIGSVLSNMDIIDSYAGKNSAGTNISKTSFITIQLDGEYTIDSIGLSYAGGAMMTDVYYTNDSDYSTASWTRIVDGSIDPTLGFTPSGYSIATFSEKNMKFIQLRGNSYTSTTIYYLDQFHIFGEKISDGYELYTDSGLTTKITSDYFQMTTANSGIDYTDTKSFWIKNISGNSKTYTINLGGTYNSDGDTAITGNNAGVNNIQLSYNDGLIQNGPIVTSSVADSSSVKVSIHASILGINLTGAGNRSFYLNIMES